MRKTSMKQAYWDWTSGLRRHGYENGFNVVTWIDWWLKTGQWENRGIRANNVCMERLDSELSYHPDNVICSNVSEARSRSAKESRRRK